MPILTLRKHLCLLHLRRGSSVAELLKLRVFWLMASLKVPCQVARPLLRSVTQQRTAFCQRSARRRRFYFDDAFHVFQEDPALLRPHFHRRGELLEMEPHRRRGLLGVLTTPWRLDEAAKRRNAAYRDLYGPLRRLWLIRKRKRGNTSRQRCCVGAGTLLRAAVHPFKPECFKGARRMDVALTAIAAYVVRELQWVLAPSRDGAGRRAAAQKFLWILG